jgi:hypothetical protein
MTKMDHRTEERLRQEARDVVKAVFSRFEQADKESAIARRDWFLTLDRCGMIGYPGLDTTHWQGLPEA